MKNVVRIIDRAVSDAYDSDKDIKYKEYLTDHIANVRKGYEWFEENLPEYTSPETRAQVAKHDLSKYNEEFIPYREYFYGDSKDPEVIDAFNKAWLNHIHVNKHHWQHWVLINDDEKEGAICIKMDRASLVEMICDWWAFSWKENNLSEIFKWYEPRKRYIKLHKETKKELDEIFTKIKELI